MATKAPKKAHTAKTKNAASKTRNTTIVETYSPLYSQNSHEPVKADFLKRQKLVDTMAALLVDSENKHHQTIGLLGDWGGGG